MQDKIFLKEILTMVKFSRPSILRLEKEGRFPLRLGKQKIDGQVYWARADVDLWIKKNKYILSKKY